jgi:hypothetical protein
VEEEEEEEEDEALAQAIVRREQRGYERRKKQEEKPHLSLHRPHLQERGESPALPNDELHDEPQKLGGNIMALESIDPVKGMAPVSFV